MTPDACRYYDRAGEQITLEQWLERYADPEYRFVRRTYVGIHGWQAVTTWVGTKYPSPLGGDIFETRWCTPDLTIPPMWRGFRMASWPDYERARDGHTEIVEWLAKFQKTPPGEIYHIDTLDTFERLLKTSSALLSRVGRRKEGCPLYPARCPAGIPLSLH